MQIFAYNRSMNHIDILLPFGLPPSEMARDLLRECQAPALATLLGRGKSSERSISYDSFSRALPHEHWLTNRFGLTTTNTEADERGNSPPIAGALLRRHHPELAQGYWFILHPAHIHVARDHLVLTDISQLALEDADSRRLFQSAQNLFEEIGRTLVYVDAATWLMRADDWANLRTSSPQAANGHNIDIWMPAGPGEQAWRKLQNEVQMQWFSESLNEHREQRGQKAINTLWLWGGADAAMTAATSPYQGSFNLRGWPHTLCPAHAAASGPADVLTYPGERALLLLDSLQEPGMSNEWGFWLERLEVLESEWFAPLLHALRGKCQNQPLQSLSLILSGQERLLEVNITTAALRKFWTRPSLSRMAA
jgi:hypothetical protein